MIYAGLLLTCLLGWLLLPGSLRAGAGSRAGFAFGGGAFAVSLQMFLYDLLGLGWGVLPLALPWFLAGVGIVYRHRDRIGRGFGRLSWRAPTWWEAALWVCVLAPLVVWLPYERLMPLTSQSWDAWAIWLFKAKAFYLDGGIRPFLLRSGEFTTQPGYPLLVPLYGTFLYVLQGGVADQAAKLLSPCFFLALLAVFYYFASRFGRPPAALSLTAMLATAPMVGAVAFELAGYADTALSFYLLAAAGFVYAWHREQRLADLAGASLAATAAAWTKNEGQFFLLAVVVLGAAGLIRSRHGWRGWLWLLVPPAMVLGSWWAVRQAYQVEAAGFTLGLELRADFFWIALRSLAARSLELTNFSLTFPLLAGAALAAPRLGLPPDFWILPGLVVWQLSGALLAYATGRNEIEWWLGTSADRILAQLVPLALLPVAEVFSRWYERADRARPDAEKPIPDSKAGRRRARRTPRR